MSDLTHHHSGFGPRLSMTLLAFLLAITPSAVLPATGTYTYTLVADSSDDVKGAVNHTIEHMSFITRPIARKRLTRLNPIPRHVQVTITADSLSVSFDQLNPIVTPLDGTEVPWRSAISKNDYTIHAVVEGDTLLQVITAPDGERTNALLFDEASGRLALHVTLTSHRLPEPLQYTLLFRRDTT
jgi:hypothetical protein